MKMTCKSCGNELQANWNKCPYCGAQNESSAENPKRKKKRFGLKWIVIVVAIFFVLMSLGDDSDTVENTDKIENENMQSIEDGVESAEDGAQEMEHNADITDVADDAFMEMLENKDIFDMNDMEIVEFVKRGHVVGNGMVTTQELVEYFMPGGEWNACDNIQSTRGYEVRVVEYVVKNEDMRMEFEISSDRYVKATRLEIEEALAVPDPDVMGVENLNTILREMYSRYCDENPITEKIDWAEYIGEDIQPLIDEGRIVSDLYSNKYVCREGCCYVTEAEGKIAEIKMNSGDYCEFTFAGLREEDTINDTLLENAGYTVIGDFDRDFGMRHGRMYAQLDKEVCVAVERVGEAEIGAIVVMDYMYIPDDIKFESETITQEMLTYIPEEKWGEYVEIEVELDYPSVYSDVIEEVCATTTLEKDSIRYVFYDIDKNGYYELLIGSSAAVLDVYTADSEGIANYVGHIDFGDETLYENREDNGLYTDWRWEGMEVINAVHMNGDEIQQYSILGGSVQEYGYDENGEAFEELAYPITIHTMSEGIVWPE